MQIACAHCLARNRVPDDRLDDGPRCGQCHRALLAGEPVPISGNDLVRFVSGTQLPVIVDFWAEWCGPCHAVAPVLERIADEHDVKIVKVDIDREQGLAQRYGVASIPMMVLFENGEPQASAVGAMPKGALERTLGLAEAE